MRHKRCVTNSSLQNFEIIVADNHSKDKTREIAASYGCTIVDGGIASHYNASLLTTCRYYIRR